MKLGLEKNRNIEQVILTSKPPIFWKDKEIVKKQLQARTLNEIELLINKVNYIELLIKKNNKKAKDLYLRNINNVLKNNKLINSKEKYCKTFCSKKTNTSVCTPPCLKHCGETGVCKQ